ncbi:MAG: hypothetical protein IJM46_06290 [Oscillospiraceae bacterium]|nr:hypothetical protein [Oscillospiraceae bacterium]
MAVKKLKNLSCPFCGGTEFVKGRTITHGMAGGHSTGSSALIAPLRSTLFNFRVTAQTEIRVYCKNCGSLVRQYITHPEMLEEKER